MVVGELDAWGTGQDMFVKHVFFKSKPGTGDLFFVDQLTGKILLNNLYL